jgi:hypothetical protein
VSKSEGCCGFRPCELVAEAPRQFGNPEGGESPPFEAVTRQRLVKTQQAGKS